MQFHVLPMTEEDAHLVASWQYEAPYDFYSMDQDPEDLAELLDPQSWKETYFSVHSQQDELIGFFSYRWVENETVTMGLGLRPDLTGKRLGGEFVRSGVAFAQTHFSAALVRLSVATFNHRAIRVYQQAGFVPGETFMQHTNGSEYEFLSMFRQIP
jgi:[ribosomal protein S18]-alanine N-acetyltransferase